VGVIDHGLPGLLGGEGCGVHLQVAPTQLNRRVRGGEQIPLPVRLRSEAGGDDDGAAGRVTGDDFDDDLPGLPATPAGVVDEHEPCAKQPAKV